MKISLDLPDVIAMEILKDAQTDGHNNRSAVIRKAIIFICLKSRIKSYHKKRKHVPEPHLAKQLNFVSYFTSAERKASHAKETNIRLGSE